MFQCCELHERHSFSRQDGHRGAGCHDATHDDRGHACCRHDCHAGVAALLLHMMHEGRLETARDIVMVMLVSR